MKITKSQLKQLIQEELSIVLEERGQEGPWFSSFGDTFSREEAEEQSTQPPSGKITPRDVATKARDLIRTDRKIAGIRPGYDEERADETPWDEYTKTAKIILMGLRDEAYRSPAIEDYLERLSKRRHITHMPGIK